MLIKKIHTHIDDIFRRAETSIVQKQFFEDSS